MGKGLTEDQLKAITDQEMRLATGYWGGKLEEMRRKNEYYFLGLPKGDLSPPEIEGRSAVVDTTVRNTVLGMEAPLLKTFYGTENVVEFQETVEADADKAKQATDYINYILRKKNPGYKIVSTWIRDALLQKAGFVKVWWDDSIIESREEYRGQTDVQLAILLDDDEIEPIEQNSYPDEDAAKQKAQVLQQMEQKLAQMQQAAAQEQAQGQPGQASQQFMQAQAMYEQFKAQPVPMLYDVTVKRKKSGGRVCIENVPPEEFLISKKAKSIKDAPFCAHRVKRTISQLKAMGYKKVDEITSDDSSSEMNPEHVERVSYDDDAPYLNLTGESIDPSQRIVWITECYLQADVDGDGIAEWRKVVRSGNEILENVECDGPPFVELIPIPLPHRFFGLCPADLAMEPQRINTSLLRAQLDNVYLQVNGRYFAVNGQVNLDDLLTSRPGGIVRVDRPDAVGRLDQASADSGHAMELMQWFQEFTEESTGWTRQSQGGNGMPLDATATQANIQTNRADSRVEIITRQFAETGFTDLANMILKLVCQYQDKSVTIKLGNKWQNIDPREWTNGFDLSINVGLGTGNKDQQVQHLMALGQKQAMGLQIGTATPKNIYNADVKLAEALGFKNADMFFTDPDGPPDPNAPPKKPPAPDPKIVVAQMQAQAQQQIAQGQQSFEHQKHVDQMQAAQQKAQLDAQVAITQQQAQQAQAEAQARVEAERDLQKFQMELAMQERLEEKRLASEEWRAKLQSDTAIAVAQIGAKQAMDGALIAAQTNADQELANGN